MLFDLHYPFCPSSPLFKVHHQGPGGKTTLETSKTANRVVTLHEAARVAQAEISTGFCPMKTTELMALECQFITELDFASISIHKNYSWTGL